jgi:hypothetical protein
MHERGCDVEHCALCGMQAIACDCIYEVCNIDVETMEHDYPDIYRNGPTPQMTRRFDAVIAKHGGRLPWSGEWPGVAACRDLDLYARFIRGTWEKCNKEDPEATEDLNSLPRLARWDRDQRCWIAKN